MKTKRLFKEDVYLKETNAKVIEIEDTDKGTALILDRTIFFPEGGGQSSDIGMIGPYTVTYVYEQNDEIFHLLKDYDGQLKKGDTLSLSIDWTLRFDNMQRHCGEHILSGIMHKLYGGVNRGFHMGDDYMTIDISLEDKPEFKKLTWDMVKKAEYEVNQIIWENLPVITRHYDTKEEAENLPLRKKLNIEKDITIVSIGSTDNPSDCVACCGTHPALTGQVGLMKIYKVEKNKDMWRLYLEAGSRAFKKYQESCDIMTELENRLSAGSSDLLKKYEAKMEKEDELRERLSRMTKIVTDSQSEKIISEMKSTVHAKTYRDLEIDDLLNIGKNVTKEKEGLLILFHEPSNTVLLFSSDHFCGKLVKETKEEFQCKGGGGKNNARAIFETKEEAEEYIEYLKKSI